MLEDDDAIEAVLPPHTRGTVWYYTQTETAMAILRGDAFWATSITGLNDRHEMVFGMNMVRTAWEERGELSINREQIERWLDLAESMLFDERLADSFVLCASTEQDSITQWDRYGYCVIGLGSELLMTKIPRPDENGGRLAPTFTTGWRPVIYDPHDQRLHVSRLFEVLEELSSRDSWTHQDGLHDADYIGMECVLRSIVYLKDPGYSSEQEVRLYGQARATGALIKEHSGAFGKSQHILVTANGVRSSGGGLPIFEIRLGDVRASVQKEADNLRKFVHEWGLWIPVEVVSTSHRVKE